MHAYACNPGPRENRGCEAIAALSLRKEGESQLSGTGLVFPVSLAVRGWHNACLLQRVNAVPGLKAEGPMLTASEHDTPREPTGVEASGPLSALGSGSSEWGQRPQAGRRDKPLVESLDDMWDDAFASW